MYPYDLETRAGKLQISISPNVMEPGAAVLTRFEEVDRAQEFIRIGLNRCSGKWNHHYFSAPLDYAKTLLSMSFRRLLLPQAAS